MTAVGGCLLGCASPPAAVPLGPVDPATAVTAELAPGTAFNSLEQRLLAGSWQLRFEVVATGAIAVKMAGELRVAEEIDLRARGTFIDTEYDLRLWTRGDRLFAGPIDGPHIEAPRPTALVPALAMGLSRMGILHNVARLTAGAVPDHADGGVRSWVQTLEHRMVGDAIAFALVVDGQPSGEATLWLDADGMPRRREQRVPFASGEMRVTERYEVLVAPPSLEGSSSSASSWRGVPATGNVGSGGRSTPSANTWAESGWSSPEMNASTDSIATPK